MMPGCYWRHYPRLRLKFVSSSPNAGILQLPVHTGGLLIRYVQAALRHFHGQDLSELRYLIV